MDFSPPFNRRSQTLKFVLISLCTVSMALLVAKIVVVFTKYTLYINYSSNYDTVTQISSDTNIILNILVTTIEM